MLNNVLTTGLHVLSGIKTDIDILVSFDDHANATLMQIDGERYVIYDDPEDGWRSSGRIYKVDETLNYDIRESSIEQLKKEQLYPIQDEKIIVKYHDVAREYDGRNEYYEFLNAYTKQLILKIGTENYDDWYPCCIFEYHPENLSCNIPALSAETANLPVNPLVSPYESVSEFINAQKKHGPYIIMQDNLYCAPLNIYYTNTGDMYIDICTNEMQSVSFKDLPLKTWQDGSPCGRPAND